MIQLPHNWNTRPYQDEMWRYMVAGGMQRKRGVAVWHRRAGKDEMALHLTATAAFERIGNYWHMLPEANQARKAIWDAVNPHTGRKRIDEAFPPEIRARTRNDMMMIEFVNGSTWQVVGSDNFNSLVGSAPCGIVFSEYSIANPSSWDYLRPILKENGGWALFIYTSRGKNHGYSMYKMAETMMRQDGSWFAQRLTVDETKVLTKFDIDAERREGMSEDMIQQEYYCSFDAANPGAYYGKQMQQAWSDGRIGRVPVAPGVPCETWWDLGMDDSMSIWITQTVVREVRAVAYYENSGEGLAHYSKWLHDWAAARDLRFARHGMPPDIEVRELGTGKSRKEVCERELALKPVVVAPRLEIEDGREQVRRIIGQTWFDEEACKQGIACLTEYSKKWDDKNKVFMSHHNHNWACHGADAFRTMATIHKGRSTESKKGSDSSPHRFGSWISA
jgi:phage terminase large subunit